MEFGFGTVAKVEPGRVLPLLMRLRALYLVLAVAALSSCGSTPEPGTVTVIVQIETCDLEECFVAAVPSAKVTVEIDSAEPRTALTDGSGAAAFTIGESGQATVRAKWASQESVTSIQLNPGAQTVSLRFLRPAQVLGPDGESESGP